MVPAKKKQSAKQRRKQKPSDMPRRALSSYNLFFQEQRKLILQEEDTKDEPDSNLFANMAKTIGKRWKTLTEVDLAKYKAMADEDAKRYQLEMDAYQKKVTEKYNNNNSSDTSRREETVPQESSPPPATMQQQRSEEKEEPAEQVCRVSNILEVPQEVVVVPQAPPPMTLSPRGLYDLTLPPRQQQEQVPSVDALLVRHALEALHQERSLPPPSSSLPTMMVRDNNTSSIINSTRESALQEQLLQLPLSPALRAQLLQAIGREQQQQQQQQQEDLVRARMMQTTMDWLLQNSPSAAGRGTRAAMPMNGNHSLYPSSPWLLDLLQQQQQPTRLTTSQFFGSSSSFHATNDYEYDSFMGGGIGGGRTEGY